MLQIWFGQFCLVWCVPVLVWIVLSCLVSSGFGLGSFLLFGVPDLLWVFRLVCCVLYLVWVVLSFLLCSRFGLGSFFRCAPDLTWVVLSCLIFSDLVWVGLSCLLLSEFDLVSLGLFSLLQICRCFFSHLCVPDLVSVVFSCLIYSGFLFSVVLSSLV